MKIKPAWSVDTPIWLSKVYAHLAAWVRNRFRGFHPTAPLGVLVFHNHANCRFVDAALASESEESSSAGMKDDTTRLFSG